jgi:DHA2 family multidrug resistance protein
LFVWRELEAEQPAVNLRILRNISFSSATALGGVLGLALNGSLFLLPVFLQNLLGFNAMQSGVTLMPRSLAMAVLMPIGGRFYNRLGPRLLVGSGLLIAAYGFYTMSRLTTAVGYWDLFWPQLWQGVGFSLIFVALSTAALSTIPKPRMTAATGLYNVVRQVMGSVGIAIAATTLSSSTTRYHVILSQDAGMSMVARQRLTTLVQGMMAQGADMYTATAQARRVLDGMITASGSGARVQSRVRAGVVALRPRLPAGVSPEARFARARTWRFRSIDREGRDGAGRRVTARVRKRPEAHCHYSSRFDSS